MPRSRSPQLEVAARWSRLRRGGRSPQEAVDSFRPARHPLLSPSFNEFVFPREARTGCLLRNLPAWPRTLNLIRPQLTKPDLIRAEP